MLVDSVARWRLRSGCKRCLESPSSSIADSILGVGCCGRANRTCAIICQSMHGADELGGAGSDKPPNPWKLPYRQGSERLEGINSSAHFREEPERIAGLRCYAMFRCDFLVEIDRGFVYILDRIWRKT